MDSHARAGEALIISRYNLSNNAEKKYIFTKISQAINGPLKGRRLAVMKSFIVPDVTSNY